MTYARWRQDGYDADFVASELARGITPLPEGGLRISGDVVSGEPLILLETGVEFLEPISDADRSRIVRRALQSALKSKSYGPNVLIGEINKAARDFVNFPEKSYVLTTGLSFGHFEDISRVESSGCRLYVRRQLPRYLVEPRKEVELQNRELIRALYPEDVPNESYAAAWLHVHGRSPFEATDRALEALDLRRGIWNFALNRAIGRTFPTPNRGPLNEVLAGPLYALHNRNGSLANNGLYDPDYSAPNSSRKVQQKWDRIRKDEEAIRKFLRRSHYRPFIEEAFRKYCRALDADDLSRSFLELWGLLETLTGLGRSESHDKVVKRASFIFTRGQKTHEQVLHYLRRHRNSFAHAGEGSDQVGAYLQQLRFYVEQMLLFHLRNFRHFSSLEKVKVFLDLPPDVPALYKRLETSKKEAAEATEAARQAKEGLRFREEG